MMARTVASVSVLSGRLGFVRDTVARESRGGRNTHSCGGNVVTRSTGSITWSSPCSIGGRCSSSSVAAFSSAAEEGSTLSGARESPDKVSVEMRACFDLVERMGRGAVYLGSARIPEVRAVPADNRVHADGYALSLKPPSPV